MLTQDYLTLSLVRLKGPEEWLLEPQRLTFIFPKGGSGKHIAGPITQRLAPGDVLVANAGAGSKVCVQGGGEAIFWSFSVCVENLLPLCGSKEICLLQNVVDNLKKPSWYPASSHLATGCHRLISEVPTQCDLEHRSQLLRIASAVLSQEFKIAQRQHPGAVGVEQHVVQIFESLSSVQILNLPVGELAEKFSCSRRHLNRLFHQYFGSSVATLKMEMRLLKAVSLLRNPDTKIIHVAEECGFNHLGLFNTCFRRRFGLSPGQWRKETGPAGIVTPVIVENDGVCPFQSKGLCPMSGHENGRISDGSRTPPAQKSGSRKMSADASHLDLHIEQQSGATAQASHQGAHPSAKMQNGL